MVLLVAIVAAPLLVVLTTSSFERTASAVPAVLSLLGVGAVCGSWIGWSSLRSVHFGHVACLAVASAWYALGVLVVAVTPDGEARCIAFKVTAAGWVASWMWSWPVSLDFLLLVRFHQRGNMGLRLWLARGSQLFWLLSAALSLPLLRADAYLVEDAVAVCALPSRPSGWPPRLLTITFGVTALFNLIVHLSTLLGRAADDMPAVVRLRHQRRAFSLGVCFCVLQPPTAAAFAYAYYAGAEGAPDVLGGPRPPRALALWAAQLGASWQGLLLGLVFGAWAEMGTALRRAGLWCRGAAAPCCASCCASCCVSCAPGCAVADEDEQPALSHEDSRFVHFEHREEHATEHADPLLRFDEHEDHPRLRVFVCLVLPLGAVIAVLVLVLTLHL